jgi:L1 cell adhesion molecule like protein
MSDDNEPVLGIDLGTTYSVVSVYHNNNVKIIQDDLGNKLIPSFISFENENKMNVGSMAKLKLDSKGTAVIYDVKRLIGRTCDDVNVIKDKTIWPFTIEPDKNNKPKIVVQVKKERKNQELIDININNPSGIKITDSMLSMNEKKLNDAEALNNYSEKHKIPTVRKEFYPEEISSYVLKKLKEMAETDLNTTIKKAVITVPAYFNNSQRESTKLAGEMAGLEVLRIINEPTAAALAYGLNENKNNENKNILVFDLGGGTFDVTILSLEKNDDDERIFEVKSTDGDTHLGGQDFDQILYELSREKFYNENEGIDFDGSANAKNRVKIKCEEAKKLLSEQEQTTIKIEKLYMGSNLEITFTKKQFEENCKPLFDKCLKTVDNALRLAKLNENNINDVVLIGGSTRIPYIKNMIQNKFKHCNVHFTINPDEAVSIGAAYDAAIITQKNSDKIRDVNLFDVTPLSLGIELIGNKMDINIKRNTPTPITRKKIYQTVENNQTTVTIKIYEGENEDIRKNHLIGKFSLGNLPRLPAGKAKVEVTFFVDENNILNVSAEDISNHANKNEITIINDTGFLTKEVIAKIKENMNKYDDYEKNNQFNLIETRNLKNDMIKFREKIQNTKDIKEKYKFHKLLCKSFENYMKIFKLEEVVKNEAYFQKFIIYTKYLIKEYGVILSYRNLIEKDVLNDIKKNLFIYVIVLISNSKVSVYELLEDLKINKEINNFCCIFRIFENHIQAQLLIKNNELKNASKCFTNIIDEASIHDIDTQLNYIDQNSQKTLRDIISNAKKQLKNTDIQRVIDEAEGFFKKAINNNLLRNVEDLKRALDSYNFAIQLNKIEKENEDDIIIEKYKYDYCVYKINQILIHYLGEKNEEMKKLLEKLDKVLHEKNDYNNKEKQIINNFKIDNPNENEESTKKIIIQNPKLFEEIMKVMNKVNENVKKTAIDFVKLILRDSPYPGYNKNEFNIDEIFKKGNDEIKKFIRKLKTKYNPNKFNKAQKEQYEVAQKICAHLNNIYSSLE